jgi:hypothetical protein
MSTLTKKDLSRLAYFRTSIGGSVRATIRKMLDRANLYGIRVTSFINEVQLTVEPGMSDPDAYKLWREEFDRKYQQWEKSMKAEVQRREEKAYKEWKIACEKRVREMLEHEKIQVLRHKRRAFNKAVRINSTEDSAALVNYAMAWAVAMQQAMRGGNKIADVAEKLSQEVDYQGMSGGSSVWVVSFLVNFWRYGEALRRWHNLNTLPGIQGEQANKIKGAVINLTIISIM